MLLLPLKSRLIHPNDDLLSVFREALKNAGQALESGDILVIASKAVSYAEGRIQKWSAVSGQRSALRFHDLIKKEADLVLDETGDSEMMLTLKNKILIPNAGVDRSNVPDGYAVLWPEYPFGSARRIRRRLMSAYGLKQCGVLISDSHCQPLRIGTTGIAIGWAGFEGVRDVRGTKDLFGRKMAYTSISVADDLASAANLLMGETNASIPFVIARSAPVRFTAKRYSEDDYFIRPEECIFKGILKNSHAL